MDRVPGLYVFLLLQLLDVVTTLVGLEAGLSEANAFVRFMMQFGPLTGLLASKAVALLLAGFCVVSRRHRVIRYICYWYAALVLWNVVLICSV
jgi:hypothetical protein